MLGLATLAVAFPPILRALNTEAQYAEYGQDVQLPQMRHEAQVAESQQIHEHLQTMREKTTRETELADDVDALLHRCCRATPAPAAGDDAGGVPAVPGASEPAPVAVAPAVEYPPGSAEAYICAFTDWDCGIMVCIAARESGTDANGLLDGWWAVNTNDGDAKGIFQIRESVHAWRWPDWATGWHDMYRGVDYGHDLWAEQGYGPWYAQAGVCW